MKQSKISVAVFGVFVLATLFTAFFVATPLFAPQLPGDGLFVQRTADPLQAGEAVRMPVYESQLDAALTLPLETFGVDVAVLVEPVEAYEDAASMETAASLETAAQAQLEAVTELDVPLHLNCGGIR